MRLLEYQDLLLTITAGTVGGVLALGWVVSLVSVRGRAWLARRRRKKRVFPAGSRSLAAGELDRICARTGFSPAEAMTLHEHFLACGSCQGRADLAGLLAGLPQLAGGTLRRLPGALQLPSNLARRFRPGKGMVDFRNFMVALIPFCETAPVEDKVGLLFRLYDSDGDGVVGREDLVSFLDLVLPKEDSGTIAKAPPSDEEAPGHAALEAQGLGEERRALIEHAADAVLAELAGIGGKGKFGLEQFATIAGPTASERCTVLF